MSASRNVAGAAVWRLVALGSALATSVVVSRVLGPEGRGYFQVMITLAALGAALGGLSVEHALGTFYAEWPERRARMRAQGLMGGILLGLVIAAVVFGAVQALRVDAVPVDPPLGLLLAVTQIPFLVAGTWQQRMLLLDGKVLWAGAGTAVGAVGTLGSCAALAAFGALGSTGAVGAALLGSVALYVMGGVRSGARARNFRLSDLWDLVRLGRRFHPGQVALLLLMRFDVLVVAGIGGPAAAGVYAVAVSVTTPVDAFATTLTNAFLGDLYDSDEVAATRRAVQLFRINAIFISSLGLVVGALAPMFIPLVWGPQFSASVAPLLFLLPGVVALGVQRPLGNYFVRQRLSRVINARSILAAILDIGLCFVLIPPMGVEGAALAATIAYVAYALISAFAFAVAAKTSLTEFLPRRADFKALGTAARRLIRPSRYERRGYGISG